jgi:predicted Zn-dependent protease with MMP-like domain
MARRSARVGHRRFDELVAEALARIPPEFARHLENVSVLVESEPSAAQIRSAGLDPPRDTRLGLYEGVALPDRPHDFAGHPPDRIYVFREPILDECGNEADVRREIEVTIVHEIAHFFGLDEDHVRDLGY